MRRQSEWQLGGTAAADYHRYIVQTIILGWSSDLVEVADVRSGHRVLDVACGTGTVTRFAADRVGTTGRVVGLDMNEGMLDTARALDEQDTTAQVEWRHGDVTAMPFPDSGFDVVLCQHGLQFFADKAAALSEMHRVLGPGGRLALSVFRSLDHSPWHRAVGDAVERHVSPEAAAVIRGSFEFGDREELRALILGAGFRNVHIRIESRLIRHASIAEFLPGYLSSTPVADAFTGLDEKVMEALTHEVSTSLQPYTDDDGLAAPVECHVVTASK